MKFAKPFVLIVFILVSTQAFSNKPRRTNAFKNYNEKVHEFGYGVNMSYMRYQKTFAPQLHLHYTRYLTDYFSVGLGYGAIYDELFHNTVNLELSMRFYKRWIATFKPGVTMRNENGRKRTDYSIGISSVYEFSITENIHIGPMVEINMLQNDTNFLAGFHMGFAF